MTEHQPLCATNSKNTVPALGGNLKPLIFLKSLPPMKTKKLNALIRKCKNFSSQLGSARLCYCSSGSDECREETVYVGSSRRRYVINAKHLQHPLINALIEKSRKGENELEGKDRVSINCEVVLFDHLLWMLENADPSILDPDQSLEDLAELYML